MPVPTLFSLSAKKLCHRSHELRKELKGLHILKFVAKLFFFVII